MRLPVSAYVFVYRACSIACKVPAAAVTLCKLTHGMHIAAGTLSDMQIMVYGMSVQFFDDGRRTAQHDCSYY